MKLLTLLFVFFSTLSFAQIERVSLSPGESTLVLPGEAAVEVLCERSDGDPEHGRLGGRIRFSLRGRMGIVHVGESRVELDGRLISVPRGLIFNDKLYVFAIGINDALHYKTLNSQLEQGAWVSLGGGLATIDELIVKNNDIVIKATGTDGLPYARTLRDGWRRDSF